MWDLIILQQQEDPLNLFAVAFFTVCVDQMLDTNSQSTHDFHHAGVQIGIEARITALGAGEENRSTNIRERSDDRFNMEADSFTLIGFIKLSHLFTSTQSS